jgi:hypothetical protein
MLQSAHACGKREKDDQTESRGAGEEDRSSSPAPVLSVWSSDSANKLGANSVTQLPPSLCRSCYPLALSLSLARSLSHTIRSRPRSRALALSRDRSAVYACARATHTYSLSLPPSLSLSHTLPLSPSRSRVQTRKTEGDMQEARRVGLVVALPGRQCRW